LNHLWACTRSIGTPAPEEKTMPMLKQSSALTGSMPPAAISTLVIFAPHFRPLRPVQPVDHPRPCCSDLSVPNSVIFGRKFE